MAIVVAYDMYKEAAEGNLDPAWKVEKPVSFFVFREELARSMLQYTPTARNYPGDGFVRVSTQQHSDCRSNDSTFESKKKRKNKPDDISIASVITINHLKNHEERLCGFLDKLCDHIKAKTTFEGHNT
jgi:hypothetical protein